MLGPQRAVPPPPLPAGCDPCSSSRAVVASASWRGQQLEDDYSYNSKRKGRGERPSGGGGRGGRGGQRGSRQGQPEEDDDSSRGERSNRRAGHESERRGRDERSGLRVWRAGRGGGAIRRGDGTSREWRSFSAAGAQSLRQLEADVNNNMSTWQGMGETRRMNAALNRAAKLFQDSNRSDENLALCHAIFDTLVTAYQTMLTDGLRFSNAVDAIIPLHACAKAGYWRLGFAEELLRRLSARGGALLRANTAARKAAWSSAAQTRAVRPPLVEHDQGDLWWAVANAPSSVRPSVDLQGLLNVSAEILLDLESIDAHACNRILLASSRLGLRHERLALHLTAGLGGTGAAEDGQAIAKALQAMGTLTKRVDADAGEDSTPPRGLEAELEAGPEDGSEAEPGQPPSCALDEACMSLAVADVLDGCVRNGCTDPRIVRPLADAAVRAAPHMKGRSLSRCAWALAKIGYTEPGVYAALAEAAVQPGAMESAKAREWAALWYGLALARHRPQTPHLLALTAEAAGALRHGANPQDCANVLWALGVLRLYDERLVDALTVRLAKLLGPSSEAVNEQHLSVSLWALAVMGRSALSRHRAAGKELLRELAQLSQLQQVQVELEALGDAELYGILGGSEGAGQGSLLSAARTMAMRRTEKGVTSSIESAVVAALEELQMQLGSGVIVEVQPDAPAGQGRVADVLVELAGGRRVAVEVDGPSHFLASHPRDPAAVDGSTKLRNRQLERVVGAGNVLSVPWWEWDALKKKKARRAYLCRLLGLEVA